MHPAMQPSLIRTLLPPSGQDFVQCHSRNTHRCSSASRSGPSSQARCLSALKISRDLPCNTRTASLQPAHSQPSAHRRPRARTFARTATRAPRPLHAQLQGFSRRGAIGCAQVRKHSEHSSALNSSLAASSHRPHGDQKDLARS